MPQSIAQSERQDLCNLLEERGPLVPTLCEGWTTADLAAHLYVRESRPLASPGILVPALAGVTQREMEKAKRTLGYGGLIRKVRSGPPYPMRLVDGQANMLEYFIHHEDVRRTEADWEPRVDAELDKALWGRLKLGARFMTRKVRDTGLDLVAPGYGTIAARKGDPKAVVTGGPQELALMLFGRQGAARITVEGPEAAREAVTSARFGL